jgi:hypothetical protein
MKKLNFLNKSSFLGLMVLSFTTLVFAVIAMSNDSMKSNLDARKLTQFSKPTADSFLSGEWMSNSEEFFNDRIPFRELMISTYIQMSKTFFQQVELSGIWVEPGSKMLFDKTASLTGLDALDSNLAVLRESTSAEDVPLLLAYVPRKQEVFANKLPEHWGNSYLEQKPKTIASLTSIGETIDLSPAVNAQSDWYLTDHHWSAEGAKNAASALQNKLVQMGLPTSQVKDEINTSIKFQSFIGSIGRRITEVGIPQQDQFEIPWTSSEQISRCAKPHAKTELCNEPVIVENIGQANDKYTNRYAAFMGGDNPIEDIRGPGKGTYIVLKDSFGNSLVPYLALGSERIVAIDERHYRDGDLTELIKKVKPDAVIFLHNQLSLAGFDDQQYAVWR